MNYIIMTLSFFFVCCGLMWFDLRKYITKEDLDNDYTDDNFKEDALKRTA